MNPLKVTSLYGGYRELVAASRVGERSACSFLVKAKPVQQQGVVVHEFVATRYTANVVYQVEVLLNAI